MQPNSGALGTSVTVRIRGEGFAPLVRANYDDEGRSTISTTFSAVLGTVYQIAVDGYNGASGAITLSRTADPVQLATVTIAASDANATEGSSDDGTITITRTGSTSAALSVSLSVSGSATNNLDFVEITPSFTLPAGLASGRDTGHLCDRRTDQASCRRWNRSGDPRR